MSKLCRELVRLRTARGLTIEQVEARTHDQVGSGTLRMIEHGGAAASVETLRQLARLYRVAPWSLLKLAGYVTDQDAIDGVEAIKARRAA
jgi:transcriptional regulator with XRE-family HTH domain